MGLFDKFLKGLEKTRQNLTEKLDDLFGEYTEVDDEMFEELEYILVSSDIGINVSHQLIEDLKLELQTRKVRNPKDVKPVLADVISKRMSKHEKVQGKDGLTVTVIIGVNGVGKTTSIGKMAKYLKSKNKKVVIAAADTFRAAAIDQIKIWGERSDVPVISQVEGSDPAAVIFDAVSYAKARGMDQLICDTAGRLHNKVNLMNELAKIFRVIDREAPNANKEVLLVLDATTGQNAVNQAKLFNETQRLDGIILTKLDGTAKGGVVISICEELGIPVRFVGLGEKIDDFEEFDSESFAKNMIM